jgi:hypothetical protein
MPGAPRELDHSLPPVERVEHHRKAAKELLRAARAGQADAIGRLRDALGPLPAEVRLADAQGAIAREHGHASWAAFRRDIERQVVEPLRPVARLGPVDPARFEGAAAALLRRLVVGDEQARQRLRAHVLRFPALSSAALRNRATIANGSSCGRPLRVVRPLEIDNAVVELVFRQPLDGFDRRSRSGRSPREAGGEGDQQSRVASAGSAVLGRDADEVPDVLSEHDEAAGPRGL